jgi:YD repeat-containing protein
LSTGRYGDHHITVYACPWVAGRLELLGLGLSGGQPVLNVDYVYHPWTSSGGRLQQLKTGTPGNPTLRQDLRYTYDAVGNVLTIQDYKAGSPQTQTFTYDALDRLETAGAAGGTGGTYGPETHTYSATGNLLTKGSRTLTYPASTPGGCTSGTDSTKPHAVASVSGTPAYSYSYDCAGNATTRTVGASTYTLAYDEENQLTAVTGAATGSFVYDGDGRRVKATVGATTTVYIGDHYEWTGSTSTGRTGPRSSVPGPRSDQWSPTASQTPTAVGWAG